MAADTLQNRVLECEHAMSLRDKTILQMKFSDLRVHLDYTKELYQSFPFEMQLNIATRAVRDSLETAVDKSLEGDEDARDFGPIFGEVMLHLSLPSASQGRSSGPTSLTAFKGLDTKLFVLLRNVVIELEDFLAENSGGQDALAAAFDLESMLEGGNNNDPNKQWEEKSQTLGG